ncbi:MAG: hypothetical protein HY574_14020 [candidate division NC10 bacterium]|nr:hypothetical protein [candidate division NC10 bacterium]
MFRPSSSPFTWGRITPPHSPDGTPAGLRLSLVVSCCRYIKSNTKYFDFHRVSFIIHS